MKINRGKQDLPQLLSRALIMGAEVVLLVNSNRGNPSEFLVYSVVTGEVKFKVRIAGIRLPHDSGDKVVLKPMKLCLGEIECKELIDFLLILGIKVGGGCDVLMNITRKGELCLMSLEGLSNFHMTLQAIN
jgi:hypothetical protein